MPRRSGGDLTSQPRCYKRIGGAGNAYGHNLLKRVGGCLGLTGANGLGSLIDCLTATPGLERLLDFGTEMRSWVSV